MKKDPKKSKFNWKDFVKKKWKWMLPYAVLFVIFVSFFVVNDKPEPKGISYHQFQTMLKEKQIKSVVIEKEKEQLLITDQKKKTYTTESPSYENFKKELLESGIDVSVKQSSQWASVFDSLINLLIYGGIFFVIYRSMNGGKSKKTQNPAVIPKTKFSDIAGYAEQKQDLTTYVQYLKKPKQFRDKGAVMPKGVLLYGPPGTGKTLFARAIAGEAGVPFFSVSGSDFIEMFVGVGAKRVRNLFEVARQKAPCIIFIDEIDAIGGKRNALSNSEQNQTINALLTEMDGFQKDSGILVLATTNQPNNLDPALTRSGRFDSHISIPLPSSTEDRLQIIEVHKKEREFAKDIDFRTLAKQWIGFSGADIESLLNEAAIIAVKKNLSEITKECLDEAFYKKVLKGHVKKKGQSERDEEELKLVAYHEAGHAITRKLLNNGDVSRVTILSTTSGAGGVTFNIPQKMGLFSMEELEQEVQVLYAGRAAEYLLHNKDIRKVTTGAQNDIERATEIIKGIVMQFGLQHQPVLMNLKDFSEGKKYAFEEMKSLSEELFSKSVALLEGNYRLLEMVAERLLEKETIESDELNEIVDRYLAEKESSVA